MAAGRGRQAGGRFVFALAAAPFVERLGLGLLSRGDQEEGRGAARHLATWGRGTRMRERPRRKRQQRRAWGTGCDPLSRVEHGAAGYGVLFGEDNPRTFDTIVDVFVTEYSRAFLEVGPSKIRRFVK